MTTETNVQSALVIGGGIAGPVAAMALQKAGIDAVVYEAYPSRADDAGGGLTLAPNGLDALDVIGIGDLVRPIGTPMTGIVMQDWKGKRLGEFGNPPVCRRCSSSTAATFTGCCTRRPDGGASASNTGSG